MSSLIILSPYRHWFSCSKDMHFLDCVQVTEISPFVTPILVFVNSKSGGGQGIELYSKLSRILNPNQVFDLTATGPMAGFVQTKLINLIRNGSFSSSPLFAKNAC
jgi:hypothetical protein